MRRTTDNLLRWLAALALCAAMIALAALLMRHASAGGGIRISEVLASNSVCPAPDGSYPDFIELYNGGDAEADLSGWGLTDSGRLVKYVFPDGTLLPSGGYLVVWCDASAAEGSGLAAFSVSREGGETLSLRNRHGAVVDSVETLVMRKNQVMVRDGDGWSLSDRPTPGFENSDSGYAAYLASRNDAGRSVRITEFMSSNSLYPLPDGTLCDWIELCNTGDADFDLAGCSLSDTEDEIKYVFPAGAVLRAGEYLLLPCGDALGFSLSSAGGETLCFLSPEGRLLDRIPTPALAQDRSCALVGEDWEICERPTPGFENSDEGHEAYLRSVGVEDCGVVISEIMSRNRGCILDAAGAFSDWIELWNPGPEAADLSGFLLSDDPERPAKWRFPAGVTIPADGYLLVFCDGKDAVVDGELHCGFSLSRGGEIVTLSDPLGTAVDSASFPALEADRSFADGAVTDAPSPGYPNTAEGALAFLSSRAPAGPLVINEVMSANSAYLFQANGRYYDWAEFRNVSDEPVLLSDYTLTDDPDAPELFRFPAVTLAPGNTCVVILAGPDEFFSEHACAPFAMNAQEDWLYLYGPDGRCADYVRVAGLSYLGSIGRMDGEPGFFYFDKPTPGKPNADGARGIAAAPVADVAPGVYDGVGALEVSLSAADGAEIRYTTDGSLPTAKSALYAEPFRLEKTSVLRARSFAPGSLPSETATFSYIINEGHELPVVSIAADPMDLNGSYGILDDKASAVERMINLSFFEPEGSFSIDCGAALFGQTSRENAKKSYKLMFRPRYGGELVYPLFGADGVSRFSSLVLRSGQDYPFGIIREELMTSLAADGGDNVMVQDFRYCVVYINGRYWGIYALKERYSVEYYAAKRGVGPESVDLVRATRILDTDTNLYELMQFASSQDPTVEENYRFLADNIDPESLADWLVAETYCGNSDIINNIRYFRSMEDDGKWHYCFFDVDWSFLEHLNGPTRALTRGYLYCMIPKAMLRNPEYRAYFLSRLAYLLSGPYSEEHVLARIDELCDEIRSEVPRERERWGGTVEAWEQNVNNIKRFVTEPGRVGELLDDFCNYLNVTPEEKEFYFSGLY